MDNNPIDQPSDRYGFRSRWESCSFVIILPNANANANVKRDWYAILDVAKDWNVTMNNCIVLCGYRTRSWINCWYSRFADDNHLYTLINIRLAYQGNNGMWDANIINKENCELNPRTWVNYSNMSKLLSPENAASTVINTSLDSV